ITALTPAAARAQSKDDAARADAAFTTGKRLLQHGNEAGACAHFAESKRLAPGVGVTLYLADCYQRLGRIASAWTEFQSAEARARALVPRRRPGRTPAGARRLGNGDAGRSRRPRRRRSFGLAAPRVRGAR